MGILDSINTWKELSKSGIVTLVLISVTAGYLIGQPSELPLDPTRFAITFVAILLLASGSSALNQWQEKELDSLMPRTAKRPLPAGKLSSRQVLAFVFIFVSSGLLLLQYLSSSLFYLGLAAVISYNGLYTIWWKRHWAFAAVPGAIPGALPILMGHAAASGKVFSPSGLYVFAILFFWQMPHFWALALRYQEDYQAGGFPTLPVVYGQKVTLRQIVVWCLCYVALALMAPLFLKVRIVYLIPSLLVSLKVVVELYRYAQQPEGKKWLHFFLWVNFSLIVYLGAACVDLWSYYLPVH